MSTIHSVQIYQPRGVFQSPEAQPCTVPELTADWFTKALGRAIKTATITKEIHGTASKILFDLEYNEPQDDAAPTRVCVKAGFNPALVAAFPDILGCYRLEAQFYHYIAPQVPGLVLPQAYYTATDANPGQGIVIMEDTTATGAVYGNPLEPWLVERVRAGVKQLALLHAETWGADPLQKYPWFKPMGLRPMLEALWAPDVWAARKWPPIHEDLKDRNRVVAAYHTMWKTPDMRLQAMIHGDPHLGNTFIRADGQMGFIDWQTLHINSVLHDVAYFITGAMMPEERRIHEKGLLQCYLDDLADAGAPVRFTADEVWDEFRRQQMHGFVWSMTLPDMQPKEIIHAFTHRYATAIKDHGSLELIEAQEEYEPLASFQ